MPSVRRSSGRLGCRLGFRRRKGRLLEVGVTGDKDVGEGEAAIGEGEGGLEGLSGGEMAWWLSGCRGWGMEAGLVFGDGAALPWSRCSGGMARCG